MVRMLRWIARLLFLLALVPLWASAAGRVFYDSFESGTSQWATDTPHERCTSVTTALDGAVGAQHGSSFLRCDYGASAVFDEGAYQSLSIPLNFSNEFLIRYRWRRDANLTPTTLGSQTKIARVLYGPGTIESSTDFFSIIHPGDSIGSFCLLTGWMCSGGAWGEIGGNSATAWNEVAYYGNLSAGIYRQFVNGAISKEFTGHPFYLPSNNNFYITSNWADPHNPGTVYFDNIEIFSDTGSGGVGSMALDTMTQGGGGGDTTAPSVSMTAPTAGATVSGNVTLSASCTDNVSVSSVQFRVDGSNVGSADTSSPYSVTWDSTSVANGSHSITAVCTDSSSNSTTSSARTVTVNNTVTTYYTVSPSAGTGGSITPNSPVSVASGANTSFTITPSTGYAISSVGGTCGGNRSGNTFTTNAISGNCTVVANFAVQTLVASVSAGSGGSVTPSTRTVNYGESTTFSVTADSGRTANITGCSGSPNTGTGTFTYTTGNLTANCSITATFSSSGSIPTTPGSLQAIASGTSKINLSWTASSSPVGLSGYRVERCTGSGCSNFVQVLSLTGTSTTNTGLAASTLYRYRVRAIDVNGTYSSYSSIVEATTNSAGLPASNFSCTPVNGKAPIVATCTDLSTGTPTSWYWTCGNNTTKTTQNPTCSYSNGGRYTVCLTTNVSSQYCKAGYLYYRVRSPRNIRVQ